ncbi:MAG: hypothetical protein HQK49_17460 [Oligoflexia bacterium]|nr:hypothetical protein [Oligoflexia bacterium]
MQNDVHFILYKDKKILFTDYTNADLIKLVSVMDEAKKIIRIQPEGSVLLFSNVTNVQLNLKILDPIREYISGNKPYVKRSAMFGLSQSAANILSSIVKLTKRDNINFFNVQESAFEWLIGGIGGK